MSSETGLIIFVLCWLSPIAWVWIAKHENRKYITVATLIGGFFGLLISLIILSHKKDKEPECREDDVFECNNCSTLYRLSDYREDARMFCSNCAEEIQRPTI